MLGDLLGAGAIILGAIAIRFTGWQRIDPILSAAIGVLVIWSAWDVIRESLNILLEGLPRGLDLPEVSTAMRSVDGVLDVHDLHVWSLGSSSRALSCHILIDDMPPSQSDAILCRVNNMLGDKFHLHHTTIQFEHVNCAISDNGCVIRSTCQDLHEHDHDHSHPHHHHH